MQQLTIQQLKMMRESEDHVEFKKGEGGNVQYDGSNKNKASDRRRCILGYVVALCNEGGGNLVIGMHDQYPHQVIGTTQAKDAVGQLESDIYRDVGIRPHVYELYEGDKRVLVINVPGRPVGKVFKFEDVPLMRVGEELRPMDDKTYLSIIQEQEPDFSQKICECATIADLDAEAIAIMKRQYARKQNNPAFVSISDVQALSDLSLILGEKVTNAAVLLVGKEEFIHRVYPQAKVMLEYRNTEGQINFDSRKVFGQPFFKMIDLLWNEINLRNGNFPIREGAYIFDIPFFNEDVTREALNNAIAHRNYLLESETVIKQYPQKMEIQNAGGFPHGVTLENLLTVSSTPRNRLLADVLSKTGIVERSGQGVDKIIFNTLAEGKAKPDYSQSDDFFVRLVISSVVQYEGFARFIKVVQQELPETRMLTIFDILLFIDVLKGNKPHDKARAKELMELGYLESRGKTTSQHYIMSRRYYEISGDLAAYSAMTDWDYKQMWAVFLPFLEKYTEATKKDINKLFSGRVSDRQIRSFLEILKKEGAVEQVGENRWTKYRLTGTYVQQKDYYNKALEIGMAELRKGNSKANDGENDGENSGI